MKIGPSRWALSALVTNAPSQFCQAFSPYRGFQPAQVHQPQPMTEPKKSQCNLSFMMCSSPLKGDETNWLDSFNQLWDELNNLLTDTSRQRESAFCGDIKIDFNREHKQSPFGTEYSDYVVIRQGDQGIRLNDHSLLLNVIEQGLNNFLCSSSVDVEITTIHTGIEVTARYSDNEAVELAIKTGSDIGDTTSNKSKIEKATASEGEIRLHIPKEKVSRFSQLLEPSNWRGRHAKLDPFD